MESKRVLVVGMAKSGIAAAAELARLKAKVSVCDIKTGEQLGKEAATLNSAGVEVIAGGYPPVAGHFDLVIASPGVPAAAAPFQEAVSAGIPVWSELELAYRLSRGQTVAITGTNGKTTTTALVGQMFADAQVPVVVAGNIGTPLVGKAGETTDGHVVVLEVSSFQLEWVEKFRPKVAVMLNVTPDHLDRHGNMDNYTAVKANIFRQQSGSDYTVLNYDDHRLRKLASETPGQVIFFSNRHSLDTGVFVRNGVISIVQEEEEAVIPVEHVRIKGGHNVENALAAVAVGWAMGLETKSMRQTLETFPGVAHRLEPVAKIQGVQYINDSKGTNPDASIKALTAYPNPIILIAGGRNKGSDFSEFARVVTERTKAVILLGEAANEMETSLRESGCTWIHRVDDYRQAVPLAESLAVAGDIVLLSPACASWDMFKSYEERGELFKQLVHLLLN